MPPAAAAPIARLWKDTEKHQQNLRIHAMRLQVCWAEGEAVWEAAREIQKEFEAGVRVDLPGPRLFAWLLGLYRSVAALKYRPMWQLELSVKDIARALHYSKSAVEAALR